MIEESPSAIHAVVEQFVREELSHENAHIAGAIWSMLDAGGKRLRPRITLLAGRAVNPAAPDDPVLASYMELIHVATLIHDDVLDNADVRRGRESTNHAYGMPYPTQAWVRQRHCLPHRPAATPNCNPRLAGPQHGRIGRHDTRLPDPARR